jgi:hypothetical protein
LFFLFFYKKFRVKDGVTVQNRKDQFRTFIALTKVLAEFDSKTS